MVVAKIFATPRFRFYLYMLIVLPTALLPPLGPPQLKPSEDIPMVFASTVDDAYIEVKDPKKKDEMAQRSIMKRMRLVFKRLAYVAATHLILALFVSLKSAVMLFFGIIAFFAVLLFIRIKVYGTTEFIVRDSIKKEDTYQNKEILDFAFTLPTARLYGRKVLYQPREGFCPLGTLNTVLQSIYSKTSLAQQYEKTPERIEAFRSHPSYEALLLKYPPFPMGMTVQQLAHVVRDVQHSLPIPPAATTLSLPATGPWPRIEAIDCFDHISKDDFHNKFLPQINDPKYRFLVNFCRGPLFFSDLPSSLPNFFQRAMAGHWSPLAAFIKEKDLVLLLDVNESYGGGYMVQSQRMLEAINTADISDPYVPYRGIIRLTLSYP